MTRSLFGNTYRAHRAYSRNVPLATTVNGASDPSAICDMWTNQFKDLLNCVTTDTHKSATMNALSGICNENCMDITPDMVSVAIDRLKCGKACGSDRLFAEHYIHADSMSYCLRFSPVLSHMGMSRTLSCKAY